VTAVNRRRLALIPTLASLALVVPGLASTAVAAPAATTLPQATAPRAVALAAPSPVSDLPLVSVELTDPDPTHNTIEYLNASKDNKVASTVNLVGASDRAWNLTDLAAEIKGRGNFTFKLDKKPYQIKFSSAQAVLGMASAKTWVLLANHADPSLLRNKVAYDLADAVGMPYSPESRFVDVEINGEYLGNYLLSEKTEVKTNRVELKDPEGVLVELDNNYGLEEPYNFYTSTSTTLFTLKDAVGGVDEPLAPEVDAGWKDVQKTLNNLDALLAERTPDWSAISATIDVDSFLRYYLVYEMTENPEIVASSIYFYKDGPNDVLHAGPVWDFDSALASYAVEYLGGVPVSEYVKNARYWRNKGNGWYGQLFRNPEFVEQANDLYTAEVKSKVDDLLTQIGGYADDIDQSAALNFQRWPDVLGQPSVFGSNAHTTRPTWQGEVAYLRDWVAQRAGFLDAAYGETAPVARYATHVATIGWQPTMSTGQIAGTRDRNLSVEALRISSLTAGVSGSIEGNAHVQGIGWMGWTGQGNVLGTTGQSRRMEAVQLRLTGQIASAFDVSYRAYVGGSGWQPWVRNGATAGTTGQALRIEALMVRLLPKSPKPTYRSHVQNIGWMPYVSDGAVSGTTGRALRMEALALTAPGGPYAGDISYRGHVQSIGWQPWAGSSSIIGTTGRGLRLEALQIKLTGDKAKHFSIRYRAHVQGIGWQQWVWDGATAGTTGQSRRVEAVEVQIVPKIS
jgi:uncharacterized protein YjdB